MIPYRHEWKHEITWSDLIAVRQRMRAVSSADENAPEGRYFIRSLYFDDWTDQALREKLDGVDRREKFRLRYYNGDTGFIRLEKKSKIRGLSSKQMTEISAREAQALVDGDLAWMNQDGRPLVLELYSRMRGRGLRPKTIVDYTREPFVYGPGNVRVTLDYDIRTGLGSTDFLRRDCITVPAGDAPVILEVKWDAYLPDIIRDAVGLRGVRSAAFSKYAACRIYG